MKRMGKAAAAGAAALTALAAASFHPEARNIYRALRPSEAYDTQPPALPDDLGDPAILVFTKTNGYRHREAIDAGLALFREIAARRGWLLFHTENGAAHNPATLARFRAAVWHNASGAPVNAEQRAALKNWIENGGGFVGVHAATDDSHSGWPWYQQQLVGARFIGHTLGPQFQEAVIRVERAEHRAMRHLGAAWTHSEEWYSYDRSVRGQPGARVLAAVDETTYSPRLKLFWNDRDLSMGDHPVIWTRAVGRGRAFFSALGHSAEAYRRGGPYPGVLEGAIEWAARLAGEDDGETGGEVEAGGAADSGQ